MTTIVDPESAPVLGAVKVAAIVAIANPAAPDLSTEINAVTSVDLSCAFMANGWTPTTTQGKTTRKRRLCAKSDTEQLSPAVHSIGTLMWSEGDPQAPNATLHALMVEGAKLHLLERLGPDATDDFAIADKTRDHHVTLGRPYPVYDTTADNDEFSMAAEVVYVNSSGPVNGVVVA